MLPVLLAIDGLIWYCVYTNYKSDRSKGPYPENPMFDEDMNNLWLSKPVKVTNPIPDSDKWEDLQIKQIFQESLTPTRNEDPQPVVYCNGTPLVPFYDKDMERFMVIKNEAYLRGIYNSIPLEDGGEDELYIAWFMLKGCSRFGAERLLHTGIKPWEWTYGI